MVPRTETPAQSGRACHPTSLRFDRSPCGHPLHAYQQGTFIEKGGWATLPGSDSANSSVAQACANMLSNLK
jgi:hypothetical protein